MWEEFHLNPNVSNISFTGKYVWLNFDFGTIRLDTTNLSYEYFNSNNTPDFALSNGILGNYEFPNISNVTKNPIGGLDFFQSHRSLNYDGYNYTENLYPSQTGSNEYRFYDSTGVLWNVNTFPGSGDLTYGQGGTWMPFYNGAFKLSVDTQKEILPAVIFNTKKILPVKPSFCFLPHKIEMHFLEPIEAGTNSTELKEKVYNTMSNYYANNS